MEMKTEKRARGLFPAIFRKFSLEKRAEFESAEGLRSRMENRDKGEEGRVPTHPVYSVSWIIELAQRRRFVPSDATGGSSIEPFHCDASGVTL